MASPKETTIIYDGKTIASFSAGQTATLTTKGDEVEHNIVVVAGSGGGDPKLQEKTATENGVVLPDDGFDGLSKVTVNVVSAGGGDYDIIFMNNGVIHTIYAAMEGQSINKPPEPFDPFKNFIGWSTEEGGDTMITFPYTPTGTTTLYAKWGEGVVGFTGMTRSDSVLTLTGAVEGVAKYTTRTDGDVVSVSNDLDAYFPFNEIEEFTDGYGNVFVKFPKFYMKWVLDSNGYVDGANFAKSQVDAQYFIPDAFLDPKSDGMDEPAYLDYFAIGKYEGSNQNNRLASWGGASLLTGTKGENLRPLARSYGDSQNYYAGYQCLDFSQWICYNLLCMMYYQTANIQNVTAGNTSGGATIATGSCDAVLGMNGWNNSIKGVKMLGVENPYGSKSHFVDGVYFSGTNVYVHRFPQNFASSTTNALNTGVARVSGDIKYLRSSSIQSYVVWAVNGGSSSTYFGDKSYTSSSTSHLFAGGHSGDGAGAGLWCCVGDGSVHAGCGSRLAYRPVAL